MAKGIQERREKDSLRFGRKGENEMRDYIDEYFETGALSPSINFALFCIAFILTLATILWKLANIIG